MKHAAEAGGWEIAGAIAMVVWMVVMWAGVAVLAVGLRKPLRPWVFRTGLAVIGLGVLAQLGHFQEHVLQVGYWVGHPNSPSWMTPWGTGLANGFGQVDHTKPSLGMEILHLVGNFHFLAGLAGVALVTHHAVQSRARHWGRMGVVMQGIHGLEHIALTVSVALGAKAIGLSTFFGQLDPGPGLWTYRVWWHFVANVIGTTIFAIALWQLWRERATIAAPYRDRARTVAAKAEPAEPIEGALPALP
ncbi:hypothetical protein BJY24_006966 [Nocardia transvalensis]|uniref:Uncharacterized protein n=1 Tax=Nocardia transvalensis TaxID=37333 RepID=A0A7W9PKV8_9NOCA|nr:DUF6008 family protein [Nocardia transvalensis]MBB5918054.1 hypothetical protein [Nocardia transvalensis]